MILLFSLEQKAAVSAFAQGFMPNDTCLEKYGNGMHWHKMGHMKVTRCLYNMHIVSTSTDGTSYHGDIYLHVSNLFPHIVYMAKGLCVSVIH